MRYLVYFIIFLIVSAIILMEPWQETSTEMVDKAYISENKTQ